MTKYRTFIDSESSIGQETILSIQTNGSEYGIGISSTTESENLIALNSVGIGSTVPEYELDVVGDINFTGILRQNGSPVVDSVWSYGSGNDIYRLDSNVIIGAATSTGTASQPLQVTGGAYVSGNLGVGSTNPGQKLDVSGSIRASSQLISSVSTGTAPLSVNSTTVVTNLNADLLDGIQGSSFLRSDANDTATGNLIFSGELTFNKYGNTHFGYGGNNDIYLTYGSTGGLYARTYNGTAYSSTYTIWHSGNDGSGSGLDADLLDGIDSGSFLRSDAIDTVNATYIEFGGTAVSSTEGGEIRLTSPSGQSNGPTVIDMNGVNLRFFYANSPNKGAYLPLTSLADSAGSRILTTSDGGSGNGFDADLLDGIQGASFLRSDAADSKTAGNLTFNDNVYALFGTGSDLAIVHDGSNSFIQVQGGGVGDLYIRNLRTSGSIYLQADDSGGTLRTVFAATGASSAAELYYQGSKKFETTSTGVSVTGEVLATTHIYTTGSSTGASVEAGRGTGSVALTTNDGYGNANLCFNHRNGTPDTTGSSGRIICSVDNASPTMSLQLGSSTTSGVAVSLSTILAMNTTSATAYVDFSSTGNITAYSSDKRLKENFKHIETPLEKIQKLNGYTFDWNKKSKELGFIPKHETNDIGLLAQEVQEVLPQAVAPAPFDVEVNDDGERASKSGENYLTVQYERLVPLLVEAIKEQQKQINLLKEEISKR